MTNNGIVPAAQYVRMSTEHQQYSIENQSAAIQQYAEAHGFEIVRTYADAGRSGLVLRHRKGLQQLLQDVVGGTAAYRAVLVYDISRWGRFQDTDESAHYEFVCKAAGVPIHYCAETFPNDGSLTSLIMKALKRTMAGEFSRELGVKVLAGQKRIAGLGFVLGGLPGYGLRRMLLSRDRAPKQELVRGERKNITTDRVTLVPGPAHEVRRVREIYRMLVSGEFTIQGIVRELNRRGTRPSGRHWCYANVETILTHPKYRGCNVYARTSSRLNTKLIPLPQSEWIVAPGAFEPLVDAETFEKAQAVLAGRTCRRSNEELLNDLRTLLASEKRLSSTQIEQHGEMAGVPAYYGRFGSLQNAYKLIGYDHPEQFTKVESGRCTLALREQLLSRIVAMFPDDVSVVTSKDWPARKMLRVSGRFNVALLVVRFLPERRRWIVVPFRRERRFVTLLARLTETNDAFFDFHVLPSINRQNKFRMTRNAPWLNRGARLANLSRFCKVASEVARHKAARK